MKIVMLTGSPHKNGTTSLLADKFMEGAFESGHEGFIFDAAFKKVGGCLSCNYCREHGGECVQKDDMAQLYPKLLAADIIAFVTPLYYHGISSQLKAVIDRFYAVNDALARGRKGAVLIAACSGSQPHRMDGLSDMYKGMLSFLKWENQGVLLAPGMSVRADIEKTDYPQLAKNLGASL